MGDPGAQHAQLLDERRRLADLEVSKSHPSMDSRIANLSNSMWRW
jgi:hypothetical protein